MRTAALAFPVLALSAALTAGCATPNLRISEADQVRVQRELSGEARYLRVACNVGPLWSDTEKAFVTDRPADELDLVEHPNGKPISPPRFERVLPPGTPVRVKDVEFPAPFVMAQRVLVTPRYHPWVYLEVQGDRRPYVIVLPQEVQNFEDVRAELERYLSIDDPRPAFAALSPEARQLVQHKDAAPGMSARALEMSWGLPSRKHVDRPAGTEEWSWSPGRRHAFLREERVEKVER